MHALLSGCHLFSLALVKLETFIFDLEKFWKMNKIQPSYISEK